MRDSDGPTWINDTPPQLRPISFGPRADESPLKSIRRPNGIYDLRMLSIKTICPISFDPYHDSDDLIIKAYRSAHRTCMGAHRKGIFDPLPFAHSYPARLTSALGSSFAIAIESPVQTYFRRALQRIKPVPILRA